MHSHNGEVGRGDGLFCILQHGSCWIAVQTHESFVCNGGNGDGFCCTQHGSLKFDSDCCSGKQIHNGCIEGIYCCFCSCCKAQHGSCCTKKIKNLFLKLFIILLNIKY